MDEKIHKLENELKDKDRVIEQLKLENKTLTKINRTQESALSNYKDESPSKF